MNDDKPLSAFYASIDISKGKMFYIPRCIRVSSGKIHLKYSFTIIYSFMIWCTEDCLSTSLEIIEVKPTRKLIELLIGYEPADLTVHPPPPQTIEAGFIFFA